MQFESSTSTTATPVPASRGGVQVRFSHSIWRDDVIELRSHPSRPASISSTHDINTKLGQGIENLNPIDDKV
jgi:hypothetical protein